MEPSELMPPMSDHDAIVTLVNEVRNLGKGMNELKIDIKEVKDNVANRVSDLEREKLDKADSEKLLAEAKEIHDDHEDRIRKVEVFKENWTGKYVILAIVAMAILSVITSIVGALIIKKLTQQ